MRAGEPRPRPSSSASCSGVATRSQRFRQPATCRSRKPSGRPRSPSPHAAGSTRCRSARASTTAKPTRRRRRGASAIDGGSGAQITSPVRYSDTTKSAPTTSWSSQRTNARGRGRSARHSRDSTRYSRRHVVGAGRDHAERRAAQHEARSSSRTEQVGEVGRAVRELQHGHRRASTPSRARQVGGEPVPGELLAGRTGATSSGLLAHVSAHRPPSPTVLDQRDSTVQALMPGAP